MRWFQRAPALNIIVQICLKRNGHKLQGNVQVALRIHSMLPTCLMNRKVDVNQATFSTRVISITVRKSKTQTSQRSRQRPKRREPGARPSSDPGPVCRGRAAAVGAGGVSPFGGRNLLLHVEGASSRGGELLSSVTLVAQAVKSPPAMQDSQLQSLGWEYRLEEGMATHSVLSPGGPHGQRAIVHDVTESGTQQRKIHHLNHSPCAGQWR